MAQDSTHIRTEERNQPRVNEEEPEQESIYLLRSLGFAFLTPAFAALIYGVSWLILGLSSETAMGASVVFMAVLLVSPDKRDVDWFGLCFMTGAVGLFYIGSPISKIFGGLTCFLALLTLIDADTDKNYKRKFLLVGIYLMNAGLAVVVYEVPAWGALVLVFTYMIFYLAVRLLPIGLMARASFIDHSKK